MRRHGTLGAAYQMIQPDETARSQRHTPVALRLVFDAAQATLDRRLYRGNPHPIGSEGIACHFNICLMQNVAPVSLH